MKTVIVVSGGDAPGINTAIDCYARLAGRNGDYALGVQHGFAGLLDDQLVEIDLTLLPVLAGRGIVC